MPLIYHWEVIMQNGEAISFILFAWLKKKRSEQVFWVLLLLFCCCLFLICLIYRTIPWHFCYFSEQCNPKYRAVCWVHNPKQAGLLWPALPAFRPFLSLWQGWRGSGVGIQGGWGMCRWRQGALTWPIAVSEWCGLLSRSAVSHDTGSTIPGKV